MADAIVDGTSPMTRFFCHRCCVEIEHLLPDYTCPRCSTGFIEELERSNAEGGSGMDVDNQDLSDIEFSDTFDLPMSLLRAAREARAAVGNLQTLPAIRSESHRSSESDLEASRNTVSQHQGPVVLPPQLDNLIQDLFINLSGIGFGFPQGQGGEGFDVRLFLGNPGDYVWGQNGLDSIVTQLLNQMDGTGPPPLPKKQIEKIPITNVTQSQVDSKLQCSVCWEDFVIEEPVRQLSCQHCYHEACIIPWLELHGTCPICRQSLGDQTTVDANQDTVGPSLAALFRAANESSSGRISQSSSRNDPPNDVGN